MKGMTALGILLLAVGCQPDHQPQLVSEQLMREAIERHDAAEVEHLIRLGADPNGSTMSPLARAASYGDVDVVDVLLRAGADPNDARYRAGFTEDTALFNAARGGFTPIVQMLLQSGADPDMRADIGGASVTVLDYAITHGQREAVAALVTGGADVHTRSVWLRAGETPDDMAELLRRPNAGRTPLMAAVAAGDVSLVEFLLRAGSDPAAVDEQGRTALQLAARLDPPAPDLVRALRSAAPAR
jgi:ankyrin repeat protein